MDIPETYLLMVIPETRRAHLFWYLRLYSDRMLEEVIKSFGTLLHKTSQYLLITYSPRNLGAET